MQAALQEFVQIITGGITELASKIGAGLSAMAQSAFLTGTTDATTGVFTPTGLSTFGGVLAIFAGISLAVGLTTLVVKWVMSLGARN